MVRSDPAGQIDQVQAPGRSATARDHLKSTARDRSGRSWTDALQRSVRSAGTLEPGFRSESVGGDVRELIELVQQTLHIDMDLSDDTPLLSSGLVDSFGLVALLGAIEEQYDITLDETELGVETFDTPTQILERNQTATAER